MKRHLARVATAVSFATLAVGDAGELPTEFRLFVSGWNDTENGRYLFDEAAAASVMAAFQAWGVDLMIDLEHQALEEGAAADPNARDARGWCKLELREDGSLWAVAVTWTPDGEARLREKRQRYVSPAFAFDPETSRVTKIINVAITAIPATHDTPALVAASARGAKDLRKLSVGLAFGDVCRAIDKALMDRFSAGGSCAWPWIVDVFDASVVYELGGKFYEIAFTISGTTVTLGDTPTEVIRAYTPAPAEAAPAAPAAPAASAARKQPTAKLAAGGKTMDPKLVSDAMAAVKDKDGEKALGLLEQMIAQAAGGDAAPESADGAAASAAGTGDAAGDENKDEAQAAARMAMSLTGAKTPGEAMAELSRRSRLAVEVEEREARLAADRTALEATERRQLVGELVKLGVEIPATAWSDEKGTVPVDRLAKEPIADLRDRVAKLSAAGGTRRAAPVPPRRTATLSAPGGGGDAKEFQTPHGVVTLSARELAICTERGAKPEEYAANKALRESARQR